MIQDKIRRGGDSIWERRNSIARMYRGVDFRVNALPRAKHGDLQAGFRISTNSSHWGIPTTFNPRSPNIPGGDSKYIPG